MSVWTDMYRPMSEADAQDLIRKAISAFLTGVGLPSECACGAPMHSHPKYEDTPEQTTPYAVYAFFAYDGECLYVGQTSSVASRVSTHRMNYEPFAFHADEVRILCGCETRAGAHRMERHHIQQLKPVFNIVHSTERGYNDPRALPTVVSGKRYRTESTDRDLSDYLAAERVAPLRMVTTGRRRSA